MPNYIRFYNNNYNYVFITIVTYSRKPILIENIDLLREAFKYVLGKFSFEIFAGIVLKDHIHIILKLDDTKNYSAIVKLMKFYFSSKIKTDTVVTTSKSKKREKGIWQRRFWEHTIRDEHDLNTHLDYIHYNSYKHYQISPKEWEFSSFKKFVSNGFYDVNWCNLEDKNKITELNLE